MSIVTTRNAKIAADQKLIDGVHKFFGQFASLPVGSTTVTPADIVKVLQDRVDAGQTVLTAEAARTTAVKADRDKRAQTAAFVQSLRRMVQGMLSQSPDTLATFGLKVLKTAKKTVDVKATSLAKSKATRKARGTMGKKQKKAVKGNAPATASSGGTTASPAAPTKPNA